MQRLEIRLRRRFQLEVDDHKGVGITRQTCLIMFRRHGLTGFLPKHGRISKGALEMSSSASLREKNLSVGTESCVLHSRVYLF